MNEVGESNDTDSCQIKMNIEKVDGRSTVDRQEALQLNAG
jgi:hypothetical protein